MSEPYLPLRVMTDGKELSDWILKCTVLDFDFEGTITQKQEDLVAWFAEFCGPPTTALSVRERLKHGRHAGGALSALRDMGLVVSAGTYSRHAYDVDESG